jgi:hemolysin III
MINDPQLLEDRAHLKDEWANSLTHGIGLLGSLVGVYFLIKLCVEREDSWRLINFAIYGCSLVALYTASTLYHYFRDLKLKILFRKLDHCAIYLLIAGSYTPFTLIALQGFWGWTLFITVWILALLGILFKMFFIHRFKFLSTVVYLMMGWLILLAFEPLTTAISIEGLYWLGLGGFFYSFGIIFFILDKIPFFHAIWHLFVIGGSVCHFLAIFLYV